MNLLENWFLQFPKHIWRYLWRVALVAVSYQLAGFLAISIPGVNNLASSVWPAAGIAQAVLIILGSKFWPGIFLGALFLNTITIKQTLLFGLWGATGATIQAYIAVFLLKQTKFSPSLEKVIDVVKLVVIGGVIATQISCTIGVLSLCLNGIRDWSQYWPARWEWFLGDAMGVLIMTPLILSFAVSRSYKPSMNTSKDSRWKNRIIGGIWLTLLLGVSWLVFGLKYEISIAKYPLEYIPFPILMWGAIQFEKRGAVLGSFLVSSIAIWGGSQGGGPFIAKAENITQGIIFLQAFMGVICITSLLIAATVAERTSAENSLRESEIKYRELVQNANSIILKLDPMGQVTFFNEFAQIFFGYSESEIQGKNAIGTIIPPIDSQGTNLSELLEIILKNPELYPQCENENMRRSGERVWVAWSIKPFFDTQGNLTGLLCIGTDISDRRKAEIALQKLNEELEYRVEERTTALQSTLAALQIEQEQSEKLLLNILPEPIAERLKHGSQTIADTFAEVTVLFADIVGFTELSSQSSPSEIVGLLNEIFSRFDELAEKHKLEKIKTIGDAYMVVGGLPHHRSNHADAIVEMALDMIDAISQIKTQNNQPLAIRIGINSGPVVAGVIGIKKFIYDLWGDTVNIASRMESLGIPGSIQITSATYELLNDKYIFQKRGEIQVKGKGKMTTYFLTGRILSNQKR